MFKLLVFIFLFCLSLALSREQNVTVFDATEEFGNGTEIPKQTYKEAEKEIADFVNSILRSLLPKVIGGSDSANLTPRCTAAMMKVFGNIRRLKGWTIKMVDSMGKPTAGIIKGSSYSMGNYDQCLNISVTKKGHETANPKDAMFSGMYCKIKIRFTDVVVETAKDYHRGVVNASDLGKLKEIIQSIPHLPGSYEYMNHYLGLCLPSSCTTDDAEQLLKVIPFPGSSYLVRCETKSNENIDSTQFVIICIFLFLFCLACVSTFIDWMLHFRRRENNLIHKDNRCVSAIVAFSFCNSTKNLLKNLDEDVDGLLSGQSVRGIIVASVAWIVLGHTYTFPYVAFYNQFSHLENLSDYMKKEYFAFIIFYPLAFDALFVCSGFLLTFPLWYSSSKMQNVNVNVFRLIIKHYIRLCIPLAMCLGLIFILPLIGSGPFWKDYMSSAISRCRTHAGAHFGMYSNFLEFSEQYFPHLWYISCLAQLTLIGIFISWILSKSMKLGIFILVLMTVACNMSIGVLTYKHNLPPSYVFYFLEDKHMSLFWRTSIALPLSHFGSFAVGMLTGVLIARRVQHRIRLCLSAISWIICICLLYGLILMLYKHPDGSLGAEWSAVYASLHKTLFAVCVAWVMVACSFGSGGFVNSILSWKLFDPLYRLSYYAYVFHLVIIAFIMGVSRDQVAYFHTEMVPRALSYIAVTYIISYIFFILLEMPLKSLLCALCSRKTNQIYVTPLDKLQKSDILQQNIVQGSCKLWAVTEIKSSLSY